MVTVEVIDENTFVIQDAWDGFVRSKVQLDFNPKDYTVLVKTLFLSDDDDFRDVHQYPWYVPGNFNGDRLLANDMHHFVGLVYDCGEYERYAYAATRNAGVGVDSRRFAGFRAWSWKKYNKVICKVFYPYWKEWNERQPLDGIRSVYRMLYSVNGKPPAYYQMKRIATYAERHPYYISDILKYRYMRYALAIWEPEQAETTLQRAFEYPVMRRMLADVPGRLPASVFASVVGLGGGSIKRKLTTRMEWLAAGAMLDRAVNMLPIEALNRSTPEQVMKAYRLIAEHRHFTTSIRNAKPVMFAFEYLRDGAAAINDRVSIVGAAEAAIAWHRNNGWNVWDNEWGTEDFTDLSAIVFPEPTFKALEDPRFTRMTNVALLRAEGSEMGHCCGTYWRQCASGDSFIYSFSDPELGKATIELDGLGHVMQSWGPHNSSTPAAHLARKLVVEAMDLEEAEIDFSDFAWNW
jgi:hypothetical protein